LGLGFSDACLWTSDVPVIVLNGQDEENQSLAASYWDIVLALDPHRFLIMPGIHLRRDDPRKRVDHLAKFEGGLGLALVQTIYDAADTQVYCNPEHVQRRVWTSDRRVCRHRGRLMGCRRLVCSTYCSTAFSGVDTRLNGAGLTSILLPRTPWKDRRTNE